MFGVDFVLINTVDQHCVFVFAYNFVGSLPIVDTIVMGMSVSSERLSRTATGPGRRGYFVDHYVQKRVCNIRCDALLRSVSHSFQFQSAGSFVGVLRLETAPEGR